MTRRIKRGDNQRLLIVRKNNIILTGKIMKILSKLLILILTVAALTACIDKDEGKMQGNKASDAITKN